MGQWSDGPAGMWGGAGMEGKLGGGNPAMGMWDEALKNQASHRNMGLKNSRSSPSLRYLHSHRFSPLAVYACLKHDLHSGMRVSSANSTC